MTKNYVLFYSLGDKNKFYQQPLRHWGTIHAGSLKSSSVLLSSALPLAKANRLAISLTCTHRPPAAKRKACVDRFAFCREGPVRIPCGAEACHTVRVGKMRRTSLWKDLSM